MIHYRKYFNRITRVGQRYNSRHATDGLRGQEVHALRVVSFRKEISQQRLADILGVDKSQVTRLVTKLEAEGYLTRTVNPADRRERLIASTPKADTIRAEDLARSDLYYEWLLQALTEEEREQLGGLLQKLFDRATEARQTDFQELEARECI